jgi:hypothetical protein
VAKHDATIIVAIQNSITLAVESVVFDIDVFGSIRIIRPMLSAVVQEFTLVKSLTVKGNRSSPTEYIVRKESRHQPQKCRTWRYHSS